MKILGICGSPKKNNSTTLFALKKVMETVEEQGVETEILNLADYQFSGCIDCGYCRKQLDCSQKDDFQQHIIKILNQSDISGFVFASPVYFGGISAQMKALIDRSVMFRRNGFIFEDKIAGVLTVGRSRNGGQELAAMDLVKNALIQGMTVIPDGSPTSHFGAIFHSGHKEGIEQDALGMETAENLGKKIASLSKKLF